MRGLERLHGRGFDARFLSMMSAHHRAAIAAAQGELDHGSDPDAMSLAHDMNQMMGQQLRLMGRLTVSP